MPSFSVRALNSKTKTFCGVSGISWVDQRPMNILDHPFRSIVPDWSNLSEG